MIPPRALGTKEKSTRRFHRRKMRNASGGSLPVCCRRKMKALFQERYAVHVDEWRVFVFVIGIYLHTLSMNECFNEKNNLFSFMRTSTNDLP